MSTFATTLAKRMEGYIALHRSLGYQFRKQAASLRAFLRYVQSSDASGPLSQALAVDVVTTGDLPPHGSAVCDGVIRRFAEYYAAFDPCTESFDRLALPRSRAVPQKSVAKMDALTGKVLLVPMN